MVNSIPLLFCLISGKYFLTSSTLQSFNISGYAFLAIILCISLHPVVNTSNRVGSCVISAVIKLSCRALTLGLSLYLTTQSLGTSFKVSTPSLFKAWLGIGVAFSFPEFTRLLLLSFLNKGPNFSSFLFRKQFAFKYKLLYSDFLNHHSQLKPIYCLFLL